jgi:hypothetical protein
MEGKTTARESVSLKRREILRYTLFDEVDRLSTLLRPPEDGQS